MVTFFKTALAGAALLGLTILPLHAETIPTVIDAADMDERFAELSAKSDPAPQDLREQQAELQSLNAAPWIKLASEVSF